MQAASISYSQQLKHPNWQRKRLEMLQASEWRCERCHAKEESLHVHHRHYVKGRKPWEYERRELSVLCERCHEHEHVVKNELDELLSKTDTGTNLSILMDFYEQGLERYRPEDRHEFVGWQLIVGLLGIKGLAGNLLFHSSLTEITDKDIVLSIPSNLKELCTERALSTLESSLSAWFRRPLKVTIGLT